MRLTKRLAKRLVSSAVFGFTDRRLSRNQLPADAIVVSGFWRSGTTLLLETLANLTGARSFFEPLHFRVPRARPFHGPHLFEARGRLQSETYPYLSPGQATSSMDEFLDAMLCGELSHPWTRKARGTRQLISRQIIVKLVRGNLLLAYLEARFRPTTFFIFRHPAAVVASLRRGAANLGIYSSPEFLNILLEQSALRADFLANREDHVRRWSDSPLHRLTLVHAIANAVPLAQIDAGLCHPCHLSFEELTLQPTATLDRIVAHLEAQDIKSRAFRPTVSLGVDSLTTKRERENVPAWERCFSWKNELTTQEIDSIQSICAGFGEPLVKALVRAETLR